MNPQMKMNRQGQEQMNHEVLEGAETITISTKERRQIRRTIERQGRFGPEVVAEEELVIIKRIETIAPLIMSTRREPPMHIEIVYTAQFDEDLSPIAKIAKAARLAQLSSGASGARL